MRLYYTEIARPGHFVRNLLTQKEVGDPMFPLSQIVPSKYGIRLPDKEAVESLAAQIESQGLREPLIVRFIPDRDIAEAAGYAEEWDRNGGKPLAVCVHGLRRLEALRLLRRRTGIQTTRIVAYEMTNAQEMRDAAISNLQQADLSLVEQVRAVRLAMHRIGMTDRALASECGRSPDWVNVRSRLAILDDETLAGEKTIAQLLELADAERRRLQETQSNLTDGREANENLDFGTARNCGNENGNSVALGANGNGNGFQHNAPKNSGNGKRPFSEKITPEQLKAMYPQAFGSEADARYKEHEEGDKRRKEWFKQRLEPMIGKYALESQRITHDRITATKRDLDALLATEERVWGEKQQEMVTRSVPLDELPAARRELETILHTEEQKEKFRKLMREIEVKLGELMRELEKPIRLFAAVHYNRNGRGNPPKTSPVTREDLVEFCYDEQEKHWDRQMDSVGYYMLEGLDIRSLSGFPRVVAYLKYIALLWQMRHACGNGAWTTMADHEDPVPEFIMESLKEEIEVDLRSDLEAAIDGDRVAAVD